MTEDQRLHVAVQFLAVSLVIFAIHFLGMSGMLRVTRARRKYLTRRDGKIKVRDTGVKRRRDDSRLSAASEELRELKKQSSIACTKRLPAQPKRQ